MCKFPDSASCARTRRPHQPLSTRRRAAAFLQFLLSLTSFDGPAHDRTSLNLKTAPLFLAHGRTFPFVRSIQRVAETRDALLKKLAEKGGSDPWGTLSLDGMQTRYFNGEISQVGILKAVDERLTQLYQMMRRRFSSNGCGPGVYKFEWSKEDEDDNPKLAAWRALSEVPGAADAKQKRRDEITDSFSLTIVFDPSGGEGGGGMTSKSKGSIVLRDEKARKQAEFGRLQDTRRIAMEKALLAASNGNFDLPKLKNPLTTEDAKRRAAEFADGLSNSLSKLEKVGRGTLAAGALDSVKKNQQFTFKDVKQFVKSIFPTGAKDGGNADYEKMIDIIFPPDEAEEENLLDEIAKIKGKVNADALEKPSADPSIGDPSPIKKGDVGGPAARGRGDAVTVTKTIKSSMSMSRVDNKQAANPKATEPGPNPSKKGQSRGDKKSSGASSFAQAQSASSTPKQVAPGAGTATAMSSTPNKQVAPGAGTATATSADKDVKRKPKTLADILNLRRVLSPRERKALHLRDKFQDFPLPPEGANILAANHDVRCDTVTVGLPFGASLRTAGTLACRQGRLVLAGDEISGTFLPAAAPSDASNSLFSDEDQSGENAEKTAAVMDARSQQWTRTVDDLFEGASKEFYELNPDAPLNLNGNRFLERLRDGNSCLEVPTEVYEHGEPPADSLDPIQMQQFSVDPLYFYQTLNLDPNKFGKGGSDDQIKAAFHEVEQRYKEAKDAKSLKKVILGDDGFAQSLRESDPVPLERTGDGGVANFVELQMNKAREAYLHLFSAKARQRYKNEAAQYVQVGSRAVAVNFLGAKLDRVRLCLRNARCFECSIMPRHWGEHCLLDSGDQSFFQENLRKMEVTGQDGVVAKVRMKLSHFLQNLGDAQFESGKALSTMDRIKDTIRDYNTDLEAARSEISADIPRHLNSMGTNMQRYKRAVQESFEARGLLDPSELKYDEKKTDNADAALRDSTTGKTEFDQVPTGEWITRRKTPQDWRHMRKNGISPLKPRRRCRMSQLAIPVGPSMRMENVDEDRLNGHVSFDWANKRAATDRLTTKEPKQEQLPQVDEIAAGKPMEIVQPNVQPMEAQEMAMSAAAPDEAMAAPVEEEAQNVKKADGSIVEQKHVPDPDAWHPYAYGVDTEPQILSEKPVSGGAAAVVELQEGGGGGGHTHTGVKVHRNTDEMKTNKMNKADDKKKVKEELPTGDRDRVPPANYAEEARPSVPGNEDDEQEPGQSAASLEEDNTEDNDGGQAQESSSAKVSDRDTDESSASRKSTAWNWNKMLRRVNGRSDARTSTSTSAAERDDSQGETFGAATSSFFGRLYEKARNWFTSGDDAAAAASPPSTNQHTGQQGGTGGGAPAEDNVETTTITSNSNTAPIATSFVQLQMTEKQGRESGDEAGPTEEEQEEDKHYEAEKKEALDSIKEAWEEVQNRQNEAVDPTKPMETFSKAAEDVLTISELPVRDYEKQVRNHAKARVKRAKEEKEKKNGSRSTSSSLLQDVADIAEHDDLKHDRSAANTGETKVVEQQKDEQVQVTPQKMAAGVEEKKSK